MVLIKVLKLYNFTQSRKLNYSAAMNHIFSNKFFINGEFRNKSSTFPVYNPFNGDLICNVGNCDYKDAEEAIEAAKNAFKSWKNTTAKERHSILKKWFELIMKNQREIAETITLENGKVINESIGESAYAASFIEWLAEESRRAYGMTIPSNNKSKRFVTIKQPIGVTAMITPWNFPAAMVTRKAGASIAAGCTVVLKPSEDTPLSSLLLAKYANEAGLPAGVLNVLPTSRENTPQVGQVFCKSRDVAAISFTGSTAVGKTLLSQSADSVKRVLLELGGHAPFVVFSSADISKAVNGVIACKFRYSGQTCICANRVYVQDNIHEEFVDKLLVAMKDQLVPGNPLDTKSSHCVMINERAIEKSEAHVKDAISKGASLLTGGKRDGNFFQPTLLTNVTSQMLCSNQETFGPVLPIIKFKSEEDLLNQMNDSPVGLAGYMYSNDVGQCWRIAEQMEVGMVGINETAMSSCECPFGGVKESGLGREGSIYGVDEYMETKYLCWGI